MRSFKVFGGDPADEFRYVAERATEELATAAALDFLARAGAGTAAVVLPCDRRFINRGGRVQEVQP